MKLLLWDLDGTILDFLAAEKASLKARFPLWFHRDCTDEMVSLYSKINVSYWEKLERGEMEKKAILIRRFEDFLNEVGEDPALGERFSYDYETHLPDTIVFCDGAREVLHALSGRLPQCAITNGTKSVQDEKLKRSGLIDIFDNVYISEAVGAEKPSPLFFEAVFRDYPDISPEDMLIIGDSLTSDIRGGNNAGIPVCWYNPAGKKKTPDVRIDYEIKDLREVLNLV